MRSFFNGLAATFGVATVVVVATFLVVGLGIAATFLYLHFEGQILSQHASNVRHGLNFVQSANVRAEQYMAEYQTATDADHANAFRIQFCAAAKTIDASERQPDVQAFYLSNC